MLFFSCFCYWLFWRLPLPSPLRFCTILYFVRVNYKYYESFAIRLSLLLDVAKVFIHDFTCHNFDQAGEGETRLFMVCDQKRDQAKSKASEIFFRNFCRTSSFTRATRLAAPLEWLIFAPKRNGTYMSGTPFLTLLSFLPQRLNLSTGFWKTNLSLLQMAILLYKGPYLTQRSINENYRDL